MKVEQKQPKIATDKVLKTLWHFMSLDLAYLGIEAGHWRRDKVFPLNRWSDPYVYKAKYQLNTLMKRYVTKSELNNIEVNKKKAFDAFIATQERLCSVTPKKLSTFIVVKKAREIIKEILGTFDDEKHLEFCRFGRRSATGMTYAESYLDLRMETLTGSKGHIQWFKDKVLPKDDLLRRCTQDGTFTEIRTLTLSDVDKSWDKRRTIMKNTVLGGFYTAGIGDYMVSRLKDFGIKLSRVAEKHRSRIKRYSRDLSYVTADLSAASDSFTWSLMRSLFPTSWFRAMDFGRIPTVKIKGKKYYTMSFMTMGIGFTFPAQTIAFYAILCAIRDLLKLGKHRKPGKPDQHVSAFGDDLIYPTAMHAQVVSVLTDLGFLLNEEKTFVDIPFRESCGADFYDGVDVRPFQPEGKHEIHDGLTALSFLYKTYNGLRQRWEPCELPLAFAYLLGQMQLFTERLHQVPYCYPVTSGIQSRYVLTDPTFHQPYRSMHGDIVFLSLSLKRRLREVPIQTPYLWEFLRQKQRSSGQEDLQDFYLDPQDSTMLQWKWVKRKISRHGKPPIRKWRLTPHVSRKGASPAFTEDWTSACDFAGISEVDN